MVAVSDGQMGLLVLFGACTGIYAGLELVRLRVLLKENFDISAKLAQAKHSEALSFTLPSLHALFRDLTTFGHLLFFTYMCENFPIVSHAPKSWDRDMYWFLAGLLLVGSLFTVKKSKGTEVLNRDQSEEWKGWMQFMFLMYHYFHAEEVYNSIRVMITSYVWMTGFGNFSFFYIKQNFGLVRLVQMLWRLNFLVIFLCLAMGNTYILYYICPLHTFYFFMVYISMRISPTSNHGKWDVRVKLAGLALFIFLVWDCFNGKLFTLFFSPFLSTTPVIGAKSGTLWEWYFRSGLDHWSTILGMIFALNFPMLTRWFQKVEELPKKQEFMVKGLTGVAVGIPLLWWITVIFPQQKIDYNHTNAYYGFIPMLAYVYYRNSSLYLRSYYLGALHELGKITLESYLMQHHVWLTSNAKTLLMLVPGYPKINLLVCTVLFMAISQTMFRLTMSLRGMILPDDKVRCLLGFAITMGVVLLSYGLGAMINVFQVGVAPAFLCIVALTASFLVVIHRRLNFVRPLSPMATKTLDVPKLYECLKLGLMVFYLVGVYFYIQQAASRGHASSSKMSKKDAPGRVPDGSMSSPSHGILMIVICLAMLITMDSFGGFAFGALALVTGGTVNLKWEDAYEPLLRKIAPLHHGTPQNAGKYEPVSQNDSEIETGANPLHVETGSKHLEIE